VTRGSRKIELTQTEYLLLELFLLNPRQVLPRPLIFDRVWGYDFGPASNSLEVYVGYLRRKLEADGEPRLIRTVRGTGYALQEP
jgi:two-component system response regulator MprA